MDLEAYIAEQQASADAAFAFLRLYVPEADPERQRVLDVKIKAIRGFFTSAATVAESLKLALPKPKPIPPPVEPEPPANTDPQPTPP